MFVNEHIFKQSDSLNQARGVNTRQPSLYDAKGNAVAYQQTGGIVNPTKHELRVNTRLYRFASSNASVDRAVTGGWWVEDRVFDQLRTFARHHNIHPAMAARVLCGVPPEWSDMGTLVLGIVNAPLLAFKGLPNPVRVEHKDGLRPVNLPSPIESSQRRMPQLFIPGLWNYAKQTPDQVVPGAITVQNVWRISKEQANRGWIYL